MSNFASEHSQMRMPSEIALRAANDALHKDIAALLKECTEPQLTMLEYVWPGWQSLSDTPKLISVLELVQHTVAKNRAGRAS